MTFLKQLINRNSSQNTANAIRPRTRNRFELDTHTQATISEFNPISETVAPKSIDPKIRFPTPTETIAKAAPQEEFPTIPNLAVVPPEKIENTTLPAMNNTNTIIPATIAKNQVEKHQVIAPTKQASTVAEKYTRPTLLVEDEALPNLAFYKKKEGLEITDNNDITKGRTNTAITVNNNKTLTKTSIISPVFSSINNRNSLQLPKPLKVESAAPTIKISIGKIEVKALAQKEKAKPIRQKRQRTKPHLSLDDYLKQ